MRTTLRWTTTLISGLSLIGCAIDARDEDAESTSSVAERVSACVRNDTCPDPPAHSPQPPPYPPPQPRPPAPYGTPNRFEYQTLALGVDDMISKKLEATLPATNVPWPLFADPYTPKQDGVPVRVQSIPGNLWAFSSFDARGMAQHCLGQCSTAPTVFLDRMSGNYRAMLELQPRLYIEFWGVGTERNSKTGQVSRYPYLAAEITATIDVLGFAECVGWETGNGRLHALSGVHNVTIMRDSGILEDIADFFVPGYSDEINIRIRNDLMSTIGVGEFGPIKPMDGLPCTSLGVSGDATSTGAIIWNTPERFPELEHDPVIRERSGSERGIR